MTPEEALKRMKDPGEWTLRFAPRSTVARPVAPARIRPMNLAFAAIAIVAVGAAITVGAISLGNSTATPPIAATPTTSPTNPLVLRGEDSPWDSKTADWLLPNSFEMWAEHAKPTRLIVGTIEELRPGGTFKFQEDSGDGDPHYEWHTAYLGVRETSTNALVWIEMVIDSSQKASDPAVMPTIVFPNEPMIFLTDGSPKQRHNYVEVGEPGPRPPGAVLSSSGAGGLYFSDAKVFTYLLGDYPILADEEFSSLDDLADAFRNKFNLD